MHSGTTCFPLSLYFDKYTRYDFSQCLFVCVFFRSLLLDIVVHFLCSLFTWPYGCYASTLIVKNCTEVKLLLLKSRAALLLLQNS